MPVPREKALPGSYPYLPEDLWLRVASLLSTKQWARASGTCRALQQLQVESISIMSHLREASAATSALIWVARHLHGAKKIILNGWPARSAVSKVDLIAVCTAMQPATKTNALPLSLLKVLSLCIGRPQKASGKLEDPLASTYLLGILQKAINLSSLNIVCKTIPPLPQMASLKHLSLRVEDTIAEQVSEILWGMPCLEFLQLSQHPQGPKSLQSYLVVPAWVQHLELDNVFPSFLTLGSGNTRVILCGSKKGLERHLERWGDVRQQVKGLRIHNGALLAYEADGVRSKLLDNIEVLQFTEDAGFCEFCTINLEKLPDINLSSLTSLYVKVDSLSIKIPALPLLQDCRRGLWINFEDPRISAEALCTVEIASSEVYTDCNFSEFHRAMVSFGKPLMTQCCIARSHWHCTSKKYVWRSEGLHLRNPWAIECGCVGCEGSTGPVVVWGPNGEKCSWKGDLACEASEPIYYYQDEFRFHKPCVYSLHDVTPTDGSVDSDSVYYNDNHEGGSNCGSSNDEDEDEDMGFYLFD